MPQADQLASHQCVPPAGENISGTAPVESAQGRAAFAASSSRWLTQVRQNRLIFILYNLLVTLLCVWQLAGWVANGRYLETTDSGSLRLAQVQPLLMGVLITMAFAGGLGGVLCNLRGIFKFYRDEGYFPARFVIPFYLRPVMGAAAGVLMFFIGHLLSSALSDSTSMSWATLPGRLPYVAFALLAGFAVQEFNEWMKETAKTLFSDEAAASISEVEIQELARWEVKDDRLVSPEMNLLEPVGPRQVIVMCGDLLGEGYAWRVFLPGELICAPRGSSTAYRVVGGTDSARRAQARQIAKINALPALNAGESWESREVHTWC